MITLEKIDQVVERTGVSYSKAKDADKVEVDYIQKKNIKKVAGAAPGFVIYHSNWSMVATPKADLQQK